MLLKSLYRYVFGKWENLSEEEIKAIPKFFKALAHNKTLAAALKKINANTLYETLFAKQHKDTSYYLASDDTIKSALHRMEEQFHYANFDSTEWFKTYKAYYLLCELVDQLLDNKPENIEINAYKLLIAYGGENNIENALGLFDKDCQEKDLIIEENGISEGLKFTLRQSKTQQSLDLLGWRRIMQEGNRDVNMKLFYIAREIEMSLGCMPGDIKEALHAANSIDYAKRNSFPTFAGLCESAFIPEEFFDQCLISDKEKRMEARKNILSLLPQLKRVDFINSLPKIGFDFKELSALLSCLEAHEHLIFIERFKQEITTSIKKLDDLYRVLSKITSVESQRVLISMLSPQVVPSMIKDIANLDFVVEEIHTEYRYEFLASAVGCEKINALIEDGNDCVNLLTVLNLVDETDRLKLIQMVIGITNVRAAVEGFFHKEAKQKILELLPAHDRPIFLQILPTEAEKLVLRAKKKIINTNFPLGVMGMGMSGCDIILDNGKTKTVPNTVAEIWKTIQLVEKRTLSPEDAWDKMQLLALKKVSQKASTLTYLSQSNETLDFYKSFEVAEKKTSEKRCNI